MTAEERTETPTNGSCGAQPEDQDGARMEPMQLTDEACMRQIECMLFVAGDPVPVSELARVLARSVPETRALLTQMERERREKRCGILLFYTQETAQLVSNRDYAEAVQQLLQPDEVKSVSQSLMETLAVIAYRQPVTRGDVERVRGVRCEYAVSQLKRLGLIVEVGRKDVVGRPALFGTTDRFLRQFGLHSVEEMPEYLRFSKEIEEDEGEELPV